MLSAAILGDLSRQRGLISILYRRVGFKKFTPTAYFFLPETCVFVWISLVLRQILRLTI